MFVELSDETCERLDKLNKLWNEGDYAGTAQTKLAIRISGDLFVALYQARCRKDRKVVNLEAVE